MASRYLFCAAATLLLSFCASPLCAIEHLTIKQGESTREIAGKIEVEAADGGVMLLARDGGLWPVEKENIVNRRADAKPFAPLTNAELTKQLAAELPGFKTFQTQHYLIHYNTSPAYAKWVGSLFEGLHKAFYNYWSRRGAVLHEPEFPLVALVFDSQASFAKYAHAEIGERAGSIIGYYNLKTNRMVMYDLTGIEAAGAVNERNAAARINQILSQPGAERTVATVVHEATHQLAFNSGLQVRFADVPFWVSEGIAIYFETPNLESTKGWRNIGSINRVNLVNFRQYLMRRKPGSLELLLSDDKRFQDASTASDAYAEAWALNYYFLQTKSEAYVKYLAALADQKPLIDVEPADRLRQFKQFFGDDLNSVENDFLRYMRSVN
ncbi:MAG TPA: DUF1570 domain-containing protein [Pirellulaceae bacterium]